MPNFILLYISLKRLDFSRVSVFWPFDAAPLLYHFFTILSLTYVQLHLVGLKLTHTSNQ